MTRQALPLEHRDRQDGHDEEVMEMGSALGTPQWVVGVDGSKDAEVALSWAVAHAPEGSGIWAVTAWSVPVTAPIGLAGTTVAMDWTPIEQAAQERVEAAVDSVRELATQRRLQLHARAERGPAARTLLDAASAADLLVVGSRGLAGFKELVLGSVSRQVATHAPVPTAVIPVDVPLRPIRRVVIGFDGSRNAAAAISWATETLPQWADGVDFLAVGAFDVSPFEDPEMTRDRFGDDVDRVEAGFHAALDKVDPDRLCRRHFSLHGARRALAETSSDADLVVIGARGRGTIGSALLGSVSTWMLHNAGCAVVVVPGTQPEAHR